MLCLLVSVLNRRPNPHAGTGTSASVAMTKGKTNYYRLCAVDAAGNATAGLLATVKGI